MKNNYIPETMDLDIFLERNEVEKIRENPLEMSLMNFEESFNKKLLLQYKESEILGDGVEVKLEKNGEGGWDKITRFVVSINEQAYSHLKKHNKVGSRYSNGAQITIYGPK